MQVLFFTDKNCENCVALQKEMENNTINFPLIVYDYSNYPLKFKEYLIDFLPMVIILDDAWKEVKRTDKIRTYSELTSFVEAYYAKHTTRNL